MNKRSVEDVFLGLHIMYFVMGLMNYKSPDHLEFFVPRTSSFCILNHKSNIYMFACNCYDESQVRHLSLEIVSLEIAVVHIDTFNPQIGLCLKS